MRRLISILFLMTSVMLSSCRRDELQMFVSDDRTSSGFFLMNEGNMGSNKCTLDYYDYATGRYVRNIFATHNPDVTLDLGDSGNDIGLYGGKLYAVINKSNLVEVADASSVRHIAQVGVANCRNIAFCAGYAYVSSYAGASYGDPNRRRGYVAKIDTVTLQVVDTCEVGFQPEEMAVFGSKLYVANSGGYCAPDYDRTVSVIDLTSFSVVRNIDVEVNLHRMEVDARRGLLYVSSRGDYADKMSAVFIIDTRIDEVVGKIPDMNCADMAMGGDSLYVFSTEWNNETYTTVMNYSIYDLNLGKVVSNQFITDGTESQIVYPYGIAVNPHGGDIYLTDAKDFMTPGMLYCYDPSGHLKWSVVTGDLPGHFAFSY